MGHIVQCILKELSMFWLRKILILWTWNHHVISIYWLSTGDFAPSGYCQQCWRHYHQPHQGHYNHWLWGYYSHWHQNWLWGCHSTLWVYWRVSGNSAIFLKELGIDNTILFKSLNKWWVQSFIRNRVHSCSLQSLSGTIAPFTHFSLFFPLFLSLTHTLLSWPVTFLFILIFHPLPCTYTCNIHPTRQVSLLSLFPVMQSIT